MTLASLHAHTSRRIRGLMLACLSTLCVNAHAFQVSIDTSSLAGTGARLEINLLDGDTVFGNNSASAFGNTIFDPDQILHDFVAGGILTFDLSFTHNFAGGDRDVLVINLLDPGTSFSLLDTDLDALNAPVPYQDALLVCELSNAACLVPTFSDPNVTVTVPEPGPLGLLAFIPGFIGLRRAHRKYFSRS